MATIRLNRPQRLNAWTLEMGEEMRAALDECRADDVRCVVVTGAGRAFSSGADLKDALDRASRGDGKPSSIPEVLRDIYNPLIASVRDLPKPVVAAVNGPAVGIGCSLALACDLVWSAESSMFLLAFANVGLVPDGGATLFVPAAVGRARALEMALLAEPVPAPEAARIGLINRVVPDDRLEQEVRALADRLAAGPTRAYALAKQALNKAVLSGLGGQLDLEAQLQGEAASTRDFQEGVIAFVQKRAPEFAGS